MTPSLSFPPLSAVQLGGVLGRAIALNQEQHLRAFIVNETSAPIALFHPNCVAHNHEGDWYGEHAGKWLAAAARAANRSGDSLLADSVRKVADYLVSVQEADGYLGTYAPARRFMCRRGPAPRTWDGAPALRTWDIWVHAYMILGLLEAGRLLAEPRYVAAACRIGDLCWQTFTADGISVLSLGNHFGLSATVLLDPAVELYLVTKDQKYLELAESILREANAAPALELEKHALDSADAAAVGTGKAYQLLWNMVGLAKLHRATGAARHLEAVMKIWDNVRQYHLTLGGGPWGGVGHRSREVFNPQSVFSPHGYVETCSTLSWIQLNRELLLLTGEARFAAEIEKSAYNDLLGAQAPAGDNWCYYSFPNGRRVFTTYWRCCKSSGPLALEELSAVAYALDAKGAVRVNLYGPSRVSLALPEIGNVSIEQRTEYPFSGGIDLLITPQHSGTFALHVRIPDWAVGATVSVNGRDAGKAQPATFLTLERKWEPGDKVRLDFPLEPRIHERVSQSMQESRAPDGAPISQEVMHYDFIGITCGPLVYATTLIDGYKVDETVLLGPGEPRLTKQAAEPGFEGPTIRFDVACRAPLLFAPYYEAGGRRDCTWRLTWLRKAPS